MKTIKTAKCGVAQITPTALYPNKVFVAKFIETGGVRIVSKPYTYEGAELKDYKKPSVAGIGYIGKKSDVEEKIKALWRNMLYRCYGPTTVPCYEDVTVCERWHDLSKFLEDIKHLPNYYHWKTKKGWELDKDARAIKGQPKVYSPETCCFIPSEVNSSLGGMSPKRKRNAL